MKNFTSDSLRETYLSFFESKGHKRIPSASLIPENDPTVLFTTAGMHPLVPYLLGEKHPAGVRLTDVQKCVRTGDIDEVGDDKHCTFFEMLGNWSLGDYFKKEMIPWSFEFLTSEKYLGIPVDELAVSVFEGDDAVPRDSEAAELWEKCGVKKENIYFLPRSANWWGPAGLTGPCGPDTEMHIIRKPKCSPGCNPSCDCGAFMEIWNDVFMQYNKNEQGGYEPLKQKNVDTGMGLERTLCIMTGAKTVYDTDLFADAIALLDELTGKHYQDDAETTKAYRIVLDHTRTATFLLGDTKGIVPSNTDQGYVLRRLIRRAVRFGRKINLPEGGLKKLAMVFVEKYKDVYPELKENEQKIVTELTAEEEKFSKTLEGGLKEFNKVITHIQGNVFPGKTAFRLYDTYGFPVEITEELAKEQGFTVDKEGYENAFKEHQAKSHAGSEQKFACGLADHKEETTRLHTATHLLHAALKKVLSDDVQQKGSNITEERLRFDFNFPRPMTQEEIKAVEDMVNDVIAKDIPVVMKEMSVDEAKAEGYLGLFSSKYGDVVKTYSIGDFSKEICGGPHAARTGELGKFKIVKEQSSSAGIRRIKAVLEKQ
ncbi:MAG: alanine--tRNA ligase [Christensenellaceae bacterium]|nr:alanine--tRNA ligase [Christensenellaceae bacterium]MDD6926678.1 alanine--tRNA ligase [bacterium]MDY2850977.1 alanine--tRNA ligase [Christensenellaceae bacterium]